MALNLPSMNFVRRLETSGRAGRVSGGAGAINSATLAAQRLRRSRQEWMSANCGVRWPFCVLRFLCARHARATRRVTFVIERGRKGGVEFATLP
jgi:hypothetical protein